MRKKLKIFFNWTSNAGVAYYRMMNPAKYMRRLKGVEVAYSSFNPLAGHNIQWETDVMKDDKQAQEIMRLLHSLHETADVSVWQMCHNYMSLSIFLALRDPKILDKKKVLVELDDDAFNVNPESYAIQSYYPGSNAEDIVKKQLINASGLIVSTDYLKKLYSKYNPYIEVVPNGIDFEIWDKLKKPAKSDKIRIGWAGGGPHEEDLKIIGKIIPEIVNKYKDIEFMFFGHESRHIPYGVRVLHHKFKGSLLWVPIDKYPQELASLGFDIGLAPLRDNSFNRAKSNLRFLEYAALKIPTVASNIEPFKNTKSDGLLLATEPEEWIAALSRLIENERYRKALGKVAYNDVKAKYNVARIAESYLQILYRFCNGKIKSNEKELNVNNIDIIEKAS